MRNGKLFNKHTPFWIITLCALVGLTLPVLIKDGMFMDGMLYASVSHNEAIGFGTFWFPQFSKIGMAGLTSFHEQPPLVFGIQSVFFRLLGDSMYVERFYTFLMLCLTAIVINRLWKAIYKDHESLRRMGWLPLLVWITIPNCFWSYSNNMLENTMGLFTLISVLLSFKNLQSVKPYFIPMIASGIFIFLATFSKGFPGFFPVLVPVLFWITTRKISFTKSVLHSAVLLGVPLLIYTLLFLLPFGRESLSIYLFKRAFERMAASPVAETHFYTLISLSQELLPQIIVTIIAVIVARVKKVKLLQADDKRMSVFFIAIGFSASLPLMLTLVQKAFYYVPSLPFFAIGMAIVIAPVLLSFIEKINVLGKKYKVAVVIILLLFISVVSFSFSQAGKCSRDDKMLHDIYAVGKVVPKFSLIGVPDYLWNNWSMQCYFSRYFNISLTSEQNQKYYLTEENKALERDSPYRKINIQTFQYDLFLQSDSVYLSGK